MFTLVLRSVAGSVQADRAAYVKSRSGSPSFRMPTLRPSCIVHRLSSGSSESCAMFSFGLQKSPAWSDHSSSRTLPTLIRYPRGGPRTLRPNFGLQQSPPSLTSAPAAKDWYVRRRNARRGPLDRDSHVRHVGTKRRSSDLS